MPNRPGRLRHFAYKGLHAYFLTLCTHNRHRAFTDRDFAAFAVEQLLQQAKVRGFAIIAYCLMPDHVHLVLQGITEGADLKGLMASWNTRTAYEWRQRRRSRLWQPGYYDHVLRDGDDYLGVARYVLMNPVRGGLVARPEDYRWSGSTEYPIREIISAAQEWKPWW